MSESVEGTQNGAESPVDELTGGGPGNTSGEPQNGSQGKLNAEAAKYGVRAREAETALAEAKSRIDTLLQREVERIASKGLSVASDVFTLSGLTLADFLDDSGDIDYDRVTETVNDLLGTRPGLKKLARAVDPSQGQGGNPGRPKADWASFLRTDT